MSYIAVAKKLSALPKKDRKGIMNYHERLLKSGIMSGTEIASALVTGQSHLNISACPGCIDSRSTESHVPPPRLRSLSKCAKCGALLCLSKGCKAWKLDEATTCSEHESKVYCRPCNGSGDELRLRPCPVDGCNRILCKDICQKECTGEPVDVAKVVRATLSTNDLMVDRRGEPPSKKQKMDTQPRHPPRLAPCSTCLPASIWRLCSNDSNCWSASRLICPDCSPKGGKKCVGNHPAWIYDSCACYSGDTPIWDCSSCGNSYCTECRSFSSKKCDQCGASEICKKCQQKQNRTPKDRKKMLSEDDYGLKLTSGCAEKFCDRVLLCQVCVTKRKEMTGSRKRKDQCAHCSDFFCEEHLESPCISCSAEFCSQCASGAEKCVLECGQIMCDRCYGNLKPEDRTSSKCQFQCGICSDFFCKKELADTCLDCGRGICEECSIDDLEECECGGGGHAAHRKRRELGRWLVGFSY
ncbi:hypothetical protein C8J55DRAFT_317594 [Lentinula edodes]|uniref:RING-type domain-containing protein n=1 Tax=Lentinula lateritia TaxID=40482 RepID=A0A9W9AUT2_9AGAR|nr:hypothetical protein C8J55DRAFT_317594 [Lentinula edodes]